MKLIIVTNEKETKRLREVICELCPKVDFALITANTNSLTNLERAASPETILITFSTGVIIPEPLLTQFARPGYNFHAGSPDFPGRDVHHFAVYYGAHRYGATVHELAGRVDAGPIVGVDWFDVPVGTKPEFLRTMALESAHRLFKQLLPSIVAGVRLPHIGIQWSNKKWTRKDFRTMCRIDSSIDQTEFERRYHAFNSGTVSNLTIELFGRIFRIEMDQNAKLGEH